LRAQANRRPFASAVSRLLGAGADQQVRQNSRSAISSLVFTKQTSKQDDHGGDDDDIRQRQRG